MSDEKSSLLHRVLADLGSESRSPLRDDEGLADDGSPEHVDTSEPDYPKYLIYLRMPWRVDREAFVRALCGAADIAWGVCKKYPFEKQNFDTFWEGFRPRHIFFDTRETAAPTDDWSEAVFVGYLPDDPFQEDDQAIVLFLGKLLLSAFSLESGSYIFADSEELFFSASRAIGLVPDDSAHVMNLMRSGDAGAMH